MKIALFAGFFIMLASSSYAAPSKFDLTCRLQRVSGHIHFNGTHHAGEDEGVFVEYLAVDLDAMKFWELNSAMKGNFSGVDIDYSKSNEIFFIKSHGLIFSYRRDTGLAKREAQQSDKSILIDQGECVESSFEK